MHDPCTPMSVHQYAESFSIDDRHVRMMITDGALNVYYFRCPGGQRRHTRIFPDGFSWLSLPIILDSADIASFLGIPRHAVKDFDLPTYRDDSEPGERFILRIDLMHFVLTETIASENITDEV